MQNFMDIMIGKISELCEAPEWRNLVFKMANLTVTFSLERIPGFSNLNLNFWQEKTYFFSFNT